MKVYIIDDELSICKSLHWFLESVNIDATYFNSAHEFLSSYNSKLQGCILLDVRMHKMSGFELYEELVKLDNRLPIIFMSGHCGPYIEEYGKKRNVFGFIEKPFDFEMLINLIKQAHSQDRLCL